MRRVALRYGTERGQVAELWHPATMRGAMPVVVLIHGGYWRAAHTKVLMRRLAKAVTDEGWAAWNVEYRRTGRWGGGGGWPATFHDVADAVDALARVPDVDLDRVVTCGHSAGGHLALWVAGRHRLHEGDPGRPVRVVVRGAVSLAGVVDLRSGARLGLGDGAVQALIGQEPDAAPAIYDRASPAAMLPLGIPQVLVHGLGDTVVPPSMSEAYVAAAHQAGDLDAIYAPVPDIGHMDVISPRRTAWPVTRDHLRRLLAG